MSDPRGITRIDTEEIELASNEYLYCLVKSGMCEDEDGRQVIVATEVFRSKDGKTWEKWEEVAEKIVYKKRTPSEAINKITELICRDLVTEVKMICNQGFWDIEVTGKWEAEG